LVVAGTDTGYASSMISMVQELGLASAFTWIKNPTRKEIARLMHKCEIFVLPSYLESNPIVIHEAGACAKPVIASNVGGIPEVIENGKNGLLVPRGNPSALAASIMVLLRDPDLETRLGRNLQNQVLDKYNWRAVARSTEELYYRLANPPRTDRPKLVNT